MTRAQIAGYMVVVGDEMMTAEQWGIRNRIGLDTMQQRLRCGWSWERIVTTPVRPHAPWARRRVTLWGETRSIEDWAAAKGIAIATVYARTHDLKWPLHRALAAPLNAMKKLHHTPHRR